MPRHALLLWLSFGAAVAVGGGGSSSARPRNILSHVSGHERARYDLSQPPPRPALAFLSNKPPPPICPPDYAKEAIATGMISVASFLNSSRDQPEVKSVDDAPAVRSAIAVAVNCSAAVFFPPGGYSLESTVELPNEVELRGSGLSAAEFTTEPGARISGPKYGPAFLIAHAEKIQLVDLSILGQTTGVIVTDSALIRFTNVGVEAQFAGKLPGEAAPPVKGSGDGCNVAMGSNNTAVVIENSFWVWFDTAELAFFPLYDHAGTPLDRKTQWGQRPAVIVRGSSPGHKCALRDHVVGSSANCVLLRASAGTIQFISTFIVQNRSFVKTGSGQT